MKEKYFKIKPVKTTLNFVDETKVLKLSEKGLESLTCSKEEFDKIRFKEDNGTYSVNPEYSLSEISKDDAQKIIRQKEFEWACLGDYFSNSENVASPQINMFRGNL